MSDRVVNMFARIAPRYDVANTLMTAGMHHRWRRRAVQESGATTGMYILDCASGTGDFAIEFLRVVGSSGYVVATDVCQPMLEVLRHKVGNHYPNLRIEYADMQSLPYADATFDVTSCGYGVRNADNPQAALAEMARVTKPGGRVVIVETGIPSSVLLRMLYTMHTRIVVPLIGSVIAGDRAAYQYLPRTAAQFPYGEQFVTMMKETGSLEEIRYIPLLGGVSFIYVGVTRS
ncbi:MAG: ubiquinone/menaquinone biosynthesis methyltransferase [Chlorobi bacterium]|nr:ubiquinone/menaquinone biosynthesis methyltransferase [Chlorobiota bacterium]